MFLYDYSLMFLTSYSWVGVTAIGRFLGTPAVEEMLKYAWKESWCRVLWQVRRGFFPLSCRDIVEAFP